MKLDMYSPSYIESFLLNYELFVKDLAEVAADWHKLNNEEKGHYRADLLQTWGNRKVLGELFKAGKLQPAQEARLAQCDNLLLEQASLMEGCFGLDFIQLLAIFRWGTPLAKSSQTVRIEVKSVLLEHLAATLAALPHA